MDTRGLDRAPAACAEFPNDNPALHLGAIWRCTEVLGTLSCELPMRVSVVRTALAPSHDEPADTAFDVFDEPEDGEALVEIVEDLDFDDALDEGAELTLEDTASTDTPANDDPFGRLVDVLGDAARALGADEGSLVCLRALFGLARVDAIAPAEQATQALLAGHVLARSSKGLARTNEFTSQVLAWQGILRGESEDFGALGPLDEWTADVVARVVGNPARADGIRRELRRRGVAAFGIVADAA